MKERMRFWGAVVLLCASIIGSGYFAVAAVQSGVLIYGHTYPLTAVTAGGLGTIDKPVRIGVSQGGFIGCDQYKAINLTASATLATGVASKRVYICHIHIVTAGAENIALVEGTGATCVTNPVGMAGGNTAATGWNLAANTGIVLGNGVGVISMTTIDANSVCLLKSGAGQVSGTMAWAWRVPPGQF